MEIKADKLCNEVFSLLENAIRQQLKPSLLELFKSHSEHDFKSIDLQKIVDSIITPNENHSADYVFEYDKHFVKKVNENKKKVHKLNGTIQELSKKLNVISRKQVKDCVTVKSNHKSVLSKCVEYEMKLDCFNEKFGNMSVNRMNSSIVDRLAKLEEDVEVAKYAIVSNKKLIESTKKDFDENLHGLRNDLKNATRIIHDILDEHEQYSRRAILELHGVPFNRYESTNKIAIDVFAAMGIRVSYKDLDGSHRQFVSPRSHRSRRPPIILVKFVSHDLRDLIYSRRSDLRNTPGFRDIYINENLTKVRRNIFRKVRSLSDFESWSYDGKIYMRHFDHPNRRYAISTHQELHGKP